MNQFIRFRQIINDYDLLEWEIIASNHQSTFRTKIYTGKENCISILNDLRDLSKQLDGIYDLRLGGLGEEYAGGAFTARLHFSENHHSRLFIKVYLETEYFKFKSRMVSSMATMYFVTEPILFDTFITQFSGILNETREDAILPCIKF
ncbi:hypothetical protein H9Q10_11650 [Eikenella sp. S3360]|uniref:Uncharacterized protein n=1 Tax=Eikenella glucosivorans TaxID=2766967 RepID=A0ABS0NDD3_9NEIS|nr:hypothetical protein [Eikenella glucosivorans]MBH5330317.1 hypothetical protein [Eikenella glucosivorans]